MSSRWTMPARGSAALRRIAREQGVEHRARPVAGRGMDDHAGRLVDHQDVVVLVHDGERQRLGAIGAALRRRLQRDAMRWPTRTRCDGLVGGEPSSATRPPLNQALQVAARELRHEGDDDLVEPLAMDCAAATTPSRRSTAASSPSVAGRRRGSSGPSRHAAHRPYKIRLPPISERVPSTRLAHRLPHEPSISTAWRFRIAVSAISIAPSCSRAATASPRRNLPMDAGKDLCRGQGRSGVRATTRRR